MYKISADDAKKIRREMKNKKGHLSNRLLAVALRGEGYKNAEISRITKYNSNYIGELCKIYVTKGLEALATEGRKGGNNRLMSKDESTEFLKQFEESAKKGGIPRVKNIKEAYDKKTGKERKSSSSIYYLLHSKGWRKIVPKRQHPKVSKPEVIEASKKLTLSLRK